MHGNAELPQESLRERARRHPRRGFARAGPLEHVAHVGVAELEDPGEVGVARARQVHLLHLRIDRPGVHPLLPVGVVAVLDQERDRAAERAAVADAAADDRAVRLDLHPSPAAVPELPAGEVRVDVGRLELEARGQALEHGHQTGAVRLSGGGEPQPHGVKAT